MNEPIDDISKLAAEAVKDPEIRKAMENEQQNPRKWNSTIPAAVFLLAIIAGIAGVSYFAGHQKPKQTVEPCTAGPNEKCPPDEWMKSYEEFQAAQAKLKDDMQSKGITERQRMLSGWAQDLAKGIPTQEGYSFDEKTKRFVKPALPPGAGLAPTPPPTPPQVPVKK